jgi:hypothetical protein
MQSIDFNVSIFLKSGGIYEKTIVDLFNSEILFLEPESLHVSFFTRFLVDGASNVFLQQILYDLEKNLSLSYAKHVIVTSGDLEKRMKLGKRMILQFGNDRCSSRSICGTKVVNSSLVLAIFDEPDNEEQNISVSVQSILIFCYSEDYLYKNSWMWLHLTKKLHVTDYIKERITDETFKY